MHKVHSYDTLIDADTLRLNLGRPGWRVIDCRHDLLHPGAGWQAYLDGHIAGAVYAHLDRDLSGPRTPGSGRHPLPDPDRLAESFRTWGIDPQTQIVAYDASGGSFAGRLWWLARWLGHDRVALLDGGWQAALKAALTIESGAASPPPGRFERTSPREQPVHVDAVQAVRSDPDWLIVDARAPDRYAGQNETIDPVGGHIPGAVNRFWQSNLQPDGRFKSAEQLRSEFAELLGARSAAHVIAQCGSGVTACHNLLAMQRAGITGARLYPGSWSEWIADPSRPVAVGSSP
ncbi:MAG TPA: sulfurtransferase [Burkholderiaceae bacterium]|jgi:thiosulfate/3-mercaptopyruvate sulfurtransferase|nr:sulfurtransferase [Burkholderiaceae bacterium]